MPLNFKLESAYIAVKDMRRAVNFWEKFLEQPASIRDEIYTIFEIGNFRLGLFNNRGVQEKVEYGDNCLLSFEVDDIDDLQEHLKALDAKIVYPPTQIGPNYVLEFADSEGNHVEVFSKVRSE